MSFLPFKAVLILMCCITFYTLLFLKICNCQVFDEDCDRVFECVNSSIVYRDSIRLRCSGYGSCINSQLFNYNSGSGSPGIQCYTNYIVSN